MTKQEKYLIEETLNSFDFDGALKICNIIPIRYAYSNEIGPKEGDPIFKTYKSKDELIENLRYIITHVVSDYFGNCPRKEQHYFGDGFDVYLYETDSARYGVNINVKFVPLYSNTEKF